MTRNQIEFLKLLETQRANSASEIEVARANRERERQGQVALDETARRNLATEHLSSQQLLESIRHNTATETESRRHNIASELSIAQQMEETRRANLAREQISFDANAETRRSNLQREQLQAAQLEETQRANVVREQQNQQSLSETQRAHRQQERLQSSQLAETQRANRENELIRQQQLAETIRYNSVLGDLRAGELLESQRSHRASEELSLARNVLAGTQQAETVRSDLARESEQNRHNLATEAIMASKQFGSTINFTDGDVTVFDKQTPNRQQATSSNPSSSSQQVADPNLSARVTDRKVYQVYEGIGREIANAVNGSGVRVVDETMADGTHKYYEEVFRNGRTTSRKEIAKTAFDTKRSGFGSQR